jgi:hypothetical protein
MSEKAEKKGKSLSDVHIEDWREKEVSFRYKGKTYSVSTDDNLVLKTLSVSEIKNHLNSLPAKFAYWKDFQVQVERELSEAVEEYEVWFNEMYMDVDREFEKKTEGWKKSRVALDNLQEYRSRKAVLRDLEDVNKKIGVLVSSYNTMTWTLREVARLTGIEMSNLDIPIRGKGSLSDF